MNVERFNIAFLYKLLMNTFINFFLIKLLIESLNISNNEISILMIILISAISILIWRLVFKKPILVIVFIVFLVIGILYMNFNQG